MLIVIRIAVFRIFVSSGYYIGLRHHAAIEGAALGIACGAVALLGEMLFKKVLIGRIIGGLTGHVFGLLFANLLLLPLRMVVTDLPVLSFAVNALLGYGGFLLGLRRGVNLSVQGIFRIMRGQDSEENLKILDTSVIIDGRIADVCEAGCRHLTT